MPPFFWVVIGIFVLSAVVGAVARLVNNMNEAQAQAAQQAARQRPAAGAGAGNANAGGGGPVLRQANSDMDRFLAEIDRLRKKSADAPPPPQNQAPAAPVVQPAKQPDRPRPRVVAELAEPAPRVESRQEPKTDLGFSQPPPVPPTTGGIGLPMMVAAPPSGTGAPATRVTKFAGRPRAAPKTPFAKNLTGILNSGHGLALAIVLQEILGPPASKPKKA